MKHIRSKTQWRCQFRYLVHRWSSMHWV